MNGNVYNIQVLSAILHFPYKLHEKCLLPISVLKYCFAFNANKNDNISYDLQAIQML